MPKFQLLYATAGAAVFALAGPSAQANNGHRPPPGPPPPPPASADQVAKCMHDNSVLNQNSNMQKCMNSIEAYDVWAVNKQSQVIRVTWSRNGQVAYRENLEYNQSSSHRFAAADTAHIRIERLQTSLTYASPDMNCEMDLKGGGKVTQLAHDTPSGGAVNTGANSTYYYCDFSTRY